MPISSSSNSERLIATKQVFLSAFNFATSSHKSCPEIIDNVNNSAREQVEFMLEEDKDVLLVIVNSEVKLEMEKTIQGVSSVFLNELLSLVSGETSLACEADEDKTMKHLFNIEWMCKVLSKMGMMGEFVFHWNEMSNDILHVVEHNKLDSIFMNLKMKLIQLTEKAFEAIAYENVVLPYSCRLKLLNTWVPYIRKMKVFLDKNVKETFGISPENLEEMWQNIEGAIVTIILTLPSNEQASIIAEWLQPEKVMYPDLSPVFELWCYRAKSAKRRLNEAAKIWAKDNVMDRM